jgi:hypothetical protein
VQLRVPQSIPSGALVTRPLPRPPEATFSANGPGPTGPLEEPDDEPEEELDDELEEELDTPEEEEELAPEDEEEDDDEEEEDAAPEEDAFPEEEPPAGDEPSPEEQPYNIATHSMLPRRKRLM